MSACLRQSEDRQLDLRPIDRLQALQPTALTKLLQDRGIDPASTLAYRLSLHPDDVSEDFQTLDDLIKAKTIGMYQRLHDGRRLGAEANVLTFVAEPDGQARLWGFHRFVARRMGVAPGDIIYDYDAYHLLHAFISRAQQPVFYDAFPLDDVADLEGKLTVKWPAPLKRSIRRAAHPNFVITGV